MIILFLVLALITIYKVKFSNYHEDYLSPSSTNAIKGIFAIVILYSHMRGYIHLSESLWDNTYNIILNQLGQLMVAIYLFYSGYGIMESLKRKPSYFDSFPRKRILKTLIHFDIAVVCYIVVMTILGEHYPIHYYLTSWIGWDSVGNSNWFIFDILAFYLITYISSLCTKQPQKNKELICIIVSILSVVMWICLKISHKGNWWYDTILTFPLGMWYSTLKASIEKHLKRISISWFVLTLLVIVFLGWHFKIGNDSYSICACIFCLMIVVMTSKFRFDNKILQWLGVQAFAIYIMQRLPMNLYAHLGWNENPYVFAIISVPSVLLIAWGFTKILKRVDSFIYTNIPHTS